MGIVIDAKPQGPQTTAEPPVHRCMGGGAGGPEVFPRPISGNGGGNGAEPLPCLPLFPPFPPFPLENVCMRMRGWEPMEYMGGLGDFL